MFFNTPDKIRTPDGRVFFRGQKVQIKGCSQEFWVSNNISLVCWYETNKTIPLATINYENNNYYITRRPEDLAIITPYKEFKRKKGGVIKMPRIIKWIFYVMFLLLFWRVANPLLDLLLKFLQHTLIKP